MSPDRTRLDRYHTATEENLDTIVGVHDRVGRRYYATYPSMTATCAQMPVSSFQRTLALEGGAYSIFLKHKFDYRIEDRSSARMIGM